MIELDEIAKDHWFRKKPWILLGTGPSLDNFDYSKYKDTHNICGIYSACEVCDMVDLHWCQDPIAYNDLFSPERKIYSQCYDPGASRYIVTRIWNKDRYHPWPVVYYANESDTDGLLGVNKAWHVYPCSTSAAVVIQFLGRHEISKIYTAGIDGGVGVTAKNLPTRYKESHEHVRTNFTIEVEELTKWASVYNIELIKL